MIENGPGYYFELEMTISEVMVELLIILKKEAELLKDSSLLLLQDGSEEGSKIEAELKDSEIINDCKKFIFFNNLIFIFLILFLIFIKIKGNLYMGDTIYFKIIENGDEKRFTFTVRSVPYVKKEIEEDGIVTEKNLFVTFEGDKSLLSSLELDIGEHVIQIYEDVYCDNRLGHIVLTNGNFIFKNYPRTGKRALFFYVPIHSIMKLEKSGSEHKNRHSFKLFTKDGRIETFCVMKKNSIRHNIVENITTYAFTDFLYCYSFKLPEEVNNWIEKKSSRSTSSGIDLEISNRISPNQEIFNDEPLHLINENDGW